MSRLVACARVLAFLAPLVLAAPAGASTIRITTFSLLEGAPRDSPGVHYQADAGEANNVTVSLVASTYTVTDSGAVINAEAPCTSLGAHTATCPAQPAIGVAAWLEDGNDRFTSSADSADFIQGGDGDDIIDAGPGADFYVWGGAGVNTVIGGAGDDTMRLYPGIGTDDVSGGPGTDTLRYGDSPSAEVPGVSVTLDGLANDGIADEGSPGARDNVRPDVENLYGTIRDDHLTGSGGPNVIDGYDGNDTLDGAGGDDTFTKYQPNSYSTVIRGGPGEDTVDFSISYQGTDGVTIALDGQPHGALTIATDVEDAIGTNARDTIIGNAADNVDGGIGTCPDSITGLGGADAVSYAHAAWPVNVSLNGIDDDGAHGVSQFCAPSDFVERDHIATDVEAILGGPFTDQLLGDAQANRLDGAAGDDLLDGETGADVLVGGPGSTTS